jgi:hypothetical protein
VKDKASGKKPASTELDDKALDGVVGGCIPGGLSPTTIKIGTGGTGGTGPVVEGGGGGTIIKEPPSTDPGGIRFPTI